MMYRVRHVTTYRYAEPVDLGSHMLHLSPRALPHQAVHRSRIVTAPDPSRASERQDHFGNLVTWLFMDRPHDRFEVTLDATVDVLFPRPPAPEDTPPWEHVAAAAREGGAQAWQARCCPPNRGPGLMRRRVFRPAARSWPGLPTSTAAFAAISRSAPV